MNYIWIGKNHPSSPPARYRIEYDDGSIISTSLTDLQQQADQLRRELYEKTEVLSSLEQHIKEIGKLEGERRLTQKGRSVS